MNESYLDQCYLSTTPLISIREPETSLAVVRFMLGVVTERSTAKRELVLVYKNGVIDIYSVFIAVNEKLTMSTSAIISYIKNRLETEHSAHSCMIIDHATNVSLDVIDKKIQLRLGATLIATLDLSHVELLISNDGSEFEKYLSISLGYEHLSKWIIQQLVLSDKMYNAKYLHEINALKSEILLRYNHLKDKFLFKVALNSYLRANNYISNNTDLNSFWMWLDNLNHLKKDTLIATLFYIKHFDTIGTDVITIKLSQEPHTYVNQVQGHELAIRCGFTDAVSSINTSLNQFVLIELELDSKCKLLTIDFLIGFLSDAIRKNNTLVTIKSHLLLRGWDRYEKMIDQAITEIANIYYK
jgi:hypothetical protein